MSVAKPQYINVRAAGSENDLLDLTVSEGILAPELNPGVIEYSVEVDYDIDSIEIAATPADENANLTVNGEDAVSGEGKIVSLGDAGTETEIDIIVTAADNTVKIYTITVAREQDEEVDDHTDDLDTHSFGLYDPVEANFLLYNDPGDIDHVRFGPRGNADWLPVSGRW